MRTWLRWSERMHSYSMPVRSKQKQPSGVSVRHHDVPPYGAASVPCQRQSEQRLGDQASTWTSGNREIGTSQCVRGSGSSERRGGGVPLLCELRPAALGIMSEVDKRIVRWGDVFVACVPGETRMVE